MKPDGTPLMYHVNGEDKKVLKYNDYGGAATTADNSGMNVTVGIDPLHFQPAMNSGLCDKNGNDLANPIWLVIGHELGGHGYYRYVENERADPSRGHAIDYENSIKGFHGGVKEQRPYDDAHHDPSTIHQ